MSGFYWLGFRAPPLCPCPIGGWLLLECPHLHVCVDQLTSLGDHLLPSTVTSGHAVPVAQFQVISLDNNHDNCLRLRLRPLFGGGVERNLVKEDGAGCEPSWQPAHSTLVFFQKTVEPEFEWYPAWMRARVEFDNVELHVHALGFDWYPSNLIA